MGKNVVIAVSLLAAGFLAAWLRFRPYLGTEGAFTDGDRTIEIERIEELRYAVWDEPLPIEGALNSKESERAPAVSPDGRHVVFVVGERGLGTDLWICDLDARGAATDPRPLPGVNSASDEVAPTFSPEGALLFASNRPGGEGGLDLWRARYDRGIFDAPERLGGNINSPADDTDPAAVPWSGELVFSSARRRADEARVVGALRDHDLYLARPLPPDAEGRPVWDVAPLDDVNSRFDDRDPSLSADGRALLFASDRDGGAGGFDLYRSSRAPADLVHGGKHIDWLPPRPLEGVNSAAAERDPSATADGFTLLFSRRDIVIEQGIASEGTWDVWRARSRELVRTPGRPVGWREILVLVALLLLALLAALAKRWRGLDIIYKAFLVSLLVHVALLAWFREVVPESEPLPLREKDGTRVRVRLVEDPDSLSARRNMERSGEVESARTTVEASVSPDRADTAEQSPREVDAPTPGAEAVLERGEASPASAPERVQTAAAQPTVEARPTEASVRAVDESFERKTGSAPALEVAARSIDASRSAEAVTGAERSVASASDTERSLPVTAAANAGAPLERSRVRDRSSEPAPARREVLVDRAETFAAAEMGGRELEVDAPVSSFQRLASDARAATRPMDLAEAAGASLDGRTSAEPPDTALRAAASQAAPRDVGGEVAPASGAAPLARGERAASPPAPPTFVASAIGVPERGEQRGPVEVAQPIADDVPATAAPSPAFDALADVKSGAGRLARADVQPELGVRAPAGATRAEPGALTPSLLAPVGRSRSEDRPEPRTLRDPLAASAVERSNAEVSGRSVALTGPVSLDAGSAVAAASSPAFDALAGMGTDADALARADVQVDLGVMAPAGATRAEPGALRPSPLAPIGRSQPAGRPGPPVFRAPVFRAPVAASAVERSDAEASGRSVELTGPQALDAGAVVAAASGAAAVDPDQVLELVPSGLDGPLDRSTRGASAPQGPLAAPGLLAGRAAREGDGVGAPTPLTFDVAVAEGPAPAAGVAAPRRVRDQWDRTPYQSRSGERKLAALEEFGGTEQTERAVEAGLEYLASRQRQDGRWGRRATDEKYGQPLIGKTGLALLAFMGTGHTQASETRYSKVVERGLLFLVAQQDGETGHIGDCSSYGHAIATYALGEAYALTEDARLRTALEAAVQQIIDNQVASREPLLDGGWSYFYATDRRFDRWPRASVSAWQVMALESAKLGGVSVPQHVFDRARTFLVNCWDPSKGAFRYSHDPSRLTSDYSTLPGSTPATMFALSLLGVDLATEQFEPARQFVLRRAPDGYRYTGDDDFVYRARGNLYFWYYGTLAMFRVGGDDWRRWNVRMKETLVPAQEEDGSWRPISIYAEFAQDSDRDRVYTTAMNVLALEVYYRYFTPLLKVE